MSKKRFTDTQIWKKKWFRKLPVDQKLLWFFIKDECNNAGIVEFDEDLFKFYTGVEYSKEDLKAFEHRVENLKGDKFFLTTFISFQYGKLTNKCKPHKPIIEQLKKLNLFERVMKALGNPTDFTEKGIKTLEEKEKEKEKEEEKEKEYTRPISLNVDPDQLVQLWNDIMTSKGFPFVQGIGSGVHRGNFIEAQRYLRKIEDWKNLFNTCLASDFLTGKSGNWTVTLTWLCDYDNAIKVLNGEYDNNSLTKNNSSGLESWASNQ